MKTRSSSGVGHKVDLEFDVDTLRIKNLEDDEGKEQFSYKTSATYTGKFKAGLFRATLHPSNTQDWTNTLGLRGIECGVWTLGTSSEAVSGAAGLYIYNGIEGEANSAVLANLYGLKIEAVSLVGNSKLTNCYGIIVGTQAGGSTTNYAIYTSGGLVRFGDNVVMASGKTVDGVDVSAHDIATTGVHGVGGNTIIHSGDTITSLTADTLANYNTKVSDATLLDEGTVIAFAVALGG